MADKLLLSAVLICTAIVAVTSISCCQNDYPKPASQQLAPGKGLSLMTVMADPKEFLDREVELFVRYYKKGGLPCPLGPDYANFVIADVISYITLNKVWIPKEKAKKLDTLTEMEIIAVKVRVFAVDKENDPNLEVLRLAAE